MPSYYVLNLNASYNLKWFDMDNLNVWMNVANLLDKDPPYSAGSGGRCERGLLRRRRPRISGRRAHGVLTKPLRHTPARKGRIRKTGAAFFAPAPKLGSARRKAG